MISGVFPLIHHLKTSAVIMLSNTYPTVHAPLIIRGQAHDIDEQSDMLPGWDQEYRQLSCGRFVGNVAVAHAPKISIVRETTNQSLHERVAAPAGQLVFGLVLDGDKALQVNRRPVSAQSLIVIEGGRNYDFRTSGYAELVGIALDRDLFREQAGQHMSVVERAINLGVVELDASAGMMLRHFWFMLSQILQRDEATWPSTMPLDLLATTAVNNVWLALNMSQTQQPTPTFSERQGLVVQRAITYMRTNVECEFSIADVCAATHVSQRTLQYHFEHCLQISPHQYLKALRLNVARSMIRSGLGKSPGSKRAPSIAGIAANCGYDHPSRFSGDYKRQFGELPSETIKNTLRNADHGDGPA